jgi:hypothetical protein
MRELQRRISKDATLSQVGSDQRPDPLSFNGVRTVPRYTELKLSELTPNQLPSKLPAPSSDDWVDSDEFDEEDLMILAPALTADQKIWLGLSGPAFFARKPERCFRSNSWKLSPSPFEIAIREKELEQKPQRDQAIKTLILGSYWRGLYITHGLTALEQKDPSVVKLLRVISDYPEVFLDKYGLQSRQSFNRRISSKMTGDQRCDSAWMLDYLSNYYGLTHSCEDLREPASQELIRSLSPDLIVVGTFGTILTEPIISIPRYGVINLHPSALPEYPGSKPFEDMLAKDCFSTKVTAHFIVNQGIDDGPIIGASPDINIAATDQLNKDDRDSVNLWLRACHHKTALVAKEMAANIVRFIYANSDKWQKDYSKIDQFELSAPVMEMLLEPINLASYQNNFEAGDFATRVVRTYEARQHPDSEVTLAMIFDADD